MAEMNPASAQYKADLDMLNAATGGHIEKIMQVIPALRGGFGAMILAGTGAKDYAADLSLANETMAGKLDPTTRDFNRTMQTAAQQFAILTRNVEYDAAAVGEKLLPAVMHMLPAMKDIADDTAVALTWFSKLPEPIQQATYVMGGLTAANFLLGGALGRTGIGLISLIGELPIFTGAQVAATVATTGETVAANAETGAMARLAASLWAASEATVGFTVAGGADITVEGGMATATAALSGWFTTLAGSITFATGALGSFLLAAAPLGIVVGALAGVGDLAYNIADQQNKASDAEQRGDAMPDISAYVNKEAKLRADERAHPQDRGKDEQQMSMIQAIVDKVLGHKEKTASVIPDGHPNAQPHAAVHHDSITADGAPGKDKSGKSGDKTQDISDATKEIATAVTGLDIPTPRILGELTSGSKEAEIALKLLTGGITGASMAQKAYIIALAEADDRITAGKAKVGDYSRQIADLRKEQILGTDATDAQKLAYDFNREGMLQYIDYSSKMTAAEREKIKAENEHITTIRYTMTAQRENILALTQENAATDILTAAKNKLAEATMSATQAAIVGMAGSVASYNALSPAQKGVLALTETQIEQANEVKSAYTSNLGVLDDYIRKAREARDAAQGGPQSFSQQAETSISKLQSSPMYDPNDAVTKQKIAATRAAASALDDEAAITDIAKWGRAWQDTLGELSARMAGTYSIGESAFDAWKRDNLAGLASVKAALGDNYQAWEDSAKATFEQSAALQKTAANVDDFRKKAADLRHEMEIMSETDPFKKWQLQNQTFDPLAKDKSGNIGSFTNPSGVSTQQQQQLFTSQQNLDNLKQLGGDMESVFSQAFQSSYSKGIKGFFMSFEQGIDKSLYDWGVKFLGSEFYNYVMKMVSQMAGIHGPQSGGTDVGQTIALTSNTTALGVLSASVNLLNASLTAQDATSGFDAIGTAASGFASGGVFDGGGPIMVGEEGPEILHPSSGGRVLSHSDTMSAISGRGNVNNSSHITIHQHIKSNDAPALGVRRLRSRRISAGRCENARLTR